MPLSRMKQENRPGLCKKRGYILDFHVHQAERPQGVLDIALKYNAMNMSVIRGLRKISTPGKRQYVSCKEMPKVLDGAGIAIVSTSRVAFNRSTVHGGKCRRRSTLLCVVGHEER